MDDGEDVVMTCFALALSENFCEVDLLGQWLNFKLFGITYLVGKFKLLF